jgi:hypothetical protein
VNSLFIEGSEKKVSKVIPLINKHIIQNKFSRAASKKYNLTGKYAYFIPDSKGRYNRFTIIGNVFNCNHSKLLTKEIAKITEKNFS